MIEIKGKCFGIQLIEKGDEDYPYQGTKKYYPRIIVQDDEYWFAYKGTTFDLFWIDEIQSLLKIAKEKSDEKET